MNQQPTSLALPVPRDPQSGPARALRPGSVKSQINAVNASLDRNHAEVLQRLTTIERKISGLKTQSTYCSGIMGMILEHLCPGGRSADDVLDEARSVDPLTH